MRRSGTPNKTSTPAPAVTPAANATTASAGETVPVISHTMAASHKVTQAARRHGRLSHGAEATVTATAAARSAEARQRPAGQPRPLAGTGRQIAGPLSARQMNEPGHHYARQRGSTRQAGQQPEPAVPQRYDHCGGGRGDKDRQDQPRPAPGPPGRQAPEQSPRQRWLRHRWHGW